MKNKIINYIFFPIYKGIVKQLKVDFITDDLVRLGKNNDGGYVVLKSSLKKYENLLSFGIAEDISFEKKFQEYNGCSINCFDPSIDGLPELMHKTTFFKLGIDSRNYGDYINLEKVLELSDINKDSKVFMKMDIEGFEWNIFEDNESFNLLKDFEQVVIELHMKYLLGKTKYFLPIALIKRFYILKKLRKHFYFYNINANNVCGYIHFSSFIFPNVVEVSMINKRYYSYRLDQINQPSDPSLNDIQNFIIK